MFGQGLFAEVPFAEVGNPPYIHSGWIKVCKDPCNKAGWLKQEKKTADTMPCNQIINNWTVIK